MISKPSQNTTQAKSNTSDQKTKGRKIDQTQNIKPRFYRGFFMCQTELSVKELTYKEQ